MRCAIHQNKFAVKQPIISSLHIKSDSNYILPYFKSLLPGGSQKIKQSEKRLTAFSSKDTWFYTSNCTKRFGIKKSYFIQYSDLSE